ncbi:MAG: exodeoxyribonuclease V subunit gamma [Gammaproteobacteria bacterium]|nr:exodeoxyribonuclease V subunit gamma [Gammaproteobacteria bacterium]
MGLTIVSSNRVETLQARLARRLGDSPLADPFATEIVVVPTWAMGRWLNLRLARQQGIAANIDYPLPAPWIWRLATTLVRNGAGGDLWSAQRLTWWIYDRLPALLTQPDFAILASYLESDATALRRWQLAQRIAEAFDRYQTYRPRQIAAWDAGEDNSWQAQLWRALTRAIDSPHRVAAIARLANDLQRQQPEATLPARISLFALPTLPPLYLEIVQQLAKHCEVDLYLHSPTEHYWADIETARRRARQRLANPDAIAGAVDEHELLGSWGKMGQHFQDLLLDQESLSGIDIDRFDPPSGSHLLSRIQQSIFNLEQGSQTLAADDSVAIHICHSAMRECEVLVDQLLAMLEANPGLAPEDILVMVPDIAAYAPFLEAVFEASPLACNVSDISLADEHPMLASFLRLLQLPQSRFTRSDILALLDDEAVAQRFDLAGLDLDRVLRLVDEAHTRWGLDAAHKADFDLPATAGNTWAQARARFFAGFAFADDALWQGIAPLPDRDDDEAGTLGRFWQFIDRLDSWRQRLARPRPAGEWHRLLARLLDEFFIETDPRESRLQQIRDALDELLILPDSEVSPELLQRLMASWLRGRDNQGRLYSGGVTVCGMRPLRAIPFQAICLLGMNDRDFPRRDPPDELDLARGAREFEPGRRDEDRYLMLETLLSARRCLYISYTGRSLHDDGLARPSSLVQELLDFITERFHAEDGESLVDSLQQVHPMQAFSPRNFAPPRPGYRADWCQVARALGGRNDLETHGWPRHTLATGQMTSARLSQLHAFVSHPVQFFFRQRLALYLERETEQDDDEAFSLGPLQRWQLMHRLAEDLLLDRADSSERLLAGGLLAHGEAGRVQIDSARAEQQKWFEALQRFATGERRRLPLDLRLPNDLTLVGSIDGYYPGRGLMAHHAGKLRGKHRLRAWIDHLALCASDGFADGEATYLLATDAQRRYAPLPGAAARELLVDLCDLLQEGCSRPLPVLPETSFAWASADSPERAAASAWRCWANQYGRDRDDPYLALVLRAGVSVPIDEPEFADCAARLYRALLQHEVDA